MFKTKDHAFPVRVLSGGEKLCKLRWPTDAEWCQRARRIKTVVYSTGRDKLSRDVLNAKEAAAELFTAIRLDTDGVEFDAYEAQRAIGEISECDVTGCERDGDRFRITLDVIGRYETTHTLRIPTAAEASEYGRAAVKRHDERRRTIITTNLEPSGTLYDALKVEVSGYEDGTPVPIIHKDAVIVEVLQALQGGGADPDPEA